MSLDPSGTTHLLHRAMPSPEPPGLTRPVTPEKVVKVALNPDDELRNLQVALLYSMTSRRLNAQLFPPPTDPDEDPVSSANWFTIGQWAVLTVGRNLRARDMPHRASVLPERVRRRLTPTILTLRSAEDRRVAAALSFGQVMVLVSTFRALFGSSLADEAPMGPDPEIFPPLSNVDGDDDHPPAEPAHGDQTANLDPKTVRRLSAMANADAERRAAERRVAAAEDRAERETVLLLAARLGVEVEGGIYGRRSEFYMRVLDALAAKAEHHEALAYAFGLYEEAAALAQKVAKGKATRSPEDLVFEATLRIIAIEQVIVDEAVTMVVNHVPQYTADRLEGRIVTFAERSLRMPRRVAQMTTGRRLADLTAIARDVWARAMTDQVMVLAFPSETLRLGRDLPPRDWRKPFYCESLKTLSPEAQRVFDMFDRSLGDGRGAGAGDWRRFDDRMNFAANMLRSRFSDESLFWQPFTDEDVTRIWEGHYPSRIGDPYEQAVRSPRYPDELGRDLNGITHDCRALIR